MRALILGFVQALTEFLPISSSGHLVVFGDLIGGEVSSLTFDVALHAGTLVAVLGYFWRDWYRIAREGIHDIQHHRLKLGEWSMHSRLGIVIVLGTIPAVIAGLAFEQPIEDHLRDPLVVAGMLLGGGALMWVADRTGATTGRLAGITPARALIIGVAQAVALIPGTSRSGATIVAARFLGFDRVDAARFSFLLSAPVVLGAATLRLSSAWRGDEVLQWGPIMIGAIAAAITGLVVIGALLAFLRSRTLTVFVWYRIALGLLIVALVAVGVL